jgi:hypothetical protein
MSIGEKEATDALRLLSWMWMDLSILWWTKIRQSKGDRRCDGKFTSNFF